MLYTIIAIAGILVFFMFSTYVLLDELLDNFEKDNNGYYRRRNTPE